MIRHDLLALVGPVLYPVFVFIASAILLHSLYGGIKTRDYNLALLAAIMLALLAAVSLMLYGVW